MATEFSNIESIKVLFEPTKLVCLAKRLNNKVKITQWYNKSFIYNTIKHIFNNT